MTTAFPYALPPVLATYIETFDAEPQKTISRLESLLKRRGNDALGWLLLAWMFRETGNEKEALRCAQMASVFAPGSLRIHFAPYYFSHPSFFDAPRVHEALPQGEKSPSVTGTSISLSFLDTLIEQLTKPENARIEFSTNYENASDLSEQSLADGDDIVSPTLASILARQGKTADALAMYQRLDNGTGKFSSEINRLKNDL